MIEMIEKGVAVVYVFLGIQHLPRGVTNTEIVNEKVQGKNMF
jgi:hypothetical protein